MSDHHTYREDVTFKRFLVTSFYGNAVKEGKINEFWGDSYDVEKHSDFLLKSHDENTIPSFYGSIIQYSINYDPLKNAVYEDGRVNGDKNVKIRAVPPGCKIENISNDRLTESTCSPPFVTNSGFPDNMCDGGSGMVFYKVTTTFDFDGCPFYSPVSEQQKNDAYRHAYFAYRNTLFLGRDQAELLGNAHEDFPTNPALEQQMDLFNNEVGMNLADYPFATYTGEGLIKLAVENGALRIIKLGALVPSNQ